MVPRVLVGINLLLSVVSALRVAQNPSMPEVTANEDNEDAILQRLMWRQAFASKQSAALVRNTFEEENVRGPSHFEFGWENSVMVPHAYASVLDGSVNVTRSCGDLSALFWFSPHHENLPCMRDERKFTEWHGIKREVLMSDVQDHELGAKWQPPPHKDHYAKMPTLPNLFQHQAKRSIFVANKYVNEWGKGHFNYLSEELLEWMSTNIKNKCPNTQMVYARNRILNKDPTVRPKEQDTLKDFDLLKARENVVFMEDVSESQDSLSFNEVQMRAMAKHNCFASVQGGFQTLVAQFGGKHVVLHRAGSETDAFYARLARMGQGKIVVARPENPDKNWEEAFKQAFEREFLRDSCQACGIAV